MKTRYALWLLAALTLFSACETKKVLPPERRIGRQDPAVTKPKETTPSFKEEPGKDRRPPAPSRLAATGPETAAINSRLDTLQQRLQKVNGIADTLLALGPVAPPERLTLCRQSLEKAIAAYRDLKDTFALPAEAQGRQEIRPWDAYSADIDALEKGCGPVYVMEKRELQDNLGQVRLEAGKSMEPRLLQLVAEGRAIDAGGMTEQLLSQGMEMGIETRKVVAKALLREGKTLQALALIQGALAREGKKAPLDDRIFEADLLLALGRHSEARSRYGEVVQQLSTQKPQETWISGQLDILDREASQPEQVLGYEEVLRYYLGYDGTTIDPAVRDRARALLTGGTGTPVARGTATLLRRMNEDPTALQEMNMPSLMGDGTARAGEPEKPVPVEGRTVVMPTPIPPVATEERKPSPPALDPAEQAAIQNRVELEQQKQAAQWAEGGKLFDSRQYDEAIAMLKELYNTDYDGRARQKAREAENQAASDLRTQASKIYSTGRTTTNPNKKEELYLEAHRLLKNAKSRYPKADVAGKIEQNMRQIEEQLKELNPSLSL